ncbi:MAG: NAD(P)H-hydrate dehydratase [Candidatus Aenigmarchaeota archaeon]|nr:NAD(P)H-hydrate dehydratase [Candidatus Aenigmarchaeota archaeon]
MVVTKAAVRKLFPARKPWSHKGDHGRLLVVGGSKLYTGAPGLVALAALKTGVDLVTVFAPKRAADIVASLSPDLITFPARGDFLNSWHLGDALRLAAKADAVVIGNGLGDRRETAIFIEQFLEKADRPCVIDADAIRVAAKRPLRADAVLTPHAAEFVALTGDRPPEHEKDRLSLAQAAASRFACTVLLKGHVDVIASPERTATNRTGNPFMTVGGTGDVLAGICGGLLAQGAEPFAAASAAAWICGAAGDQAARRLGVSLRAADVIGAIHEVLA